MPSHSPVRFLVVLCTVGVAVAAGCRSTVLPAGSDLIPLDRVEKGSSSASGKLDGSAAQSAAVPGDDSALRGILAEPHWIRSTPRDGKEPAWRWIYPALDGILAESASACGQLPSYLADADPIVAANAAVGLGRSGNQSQKVEEALARAVRSAELETPIRCAATESLGRISAPSAVSLLRELLDDQAARADRAGGGYPVAVHGELIRALGRQVRAEGEPRLAAALNAAADEVKLAALEVWQQAPGGSFPAEGLALLNHHDPRMRTRLLPVLARHPSGDTLDHLLSALKDPDLQVRSAAIAALGTLGDPRATARLEPLLAGGTEAERIAAVRALADLGRGELVVVGARDKQWRVRLAAAESLGELPGEPEVAAAQRLLDDPSAEVQLATVARIGSWPPEKAEPLLLQALERCTYRCQKLAAESLAATWPESRPLLDAFPFGQTPALRAPAMAQIRQVYAQRSGPPGRVAAPPETFFSAEQLMSVAALLQVLQTSGVDANQRGRALASLRQLGTAGVDMLEHLAIHRGIVLHDCVYSELLADSMPDFAAVERLGSGDAQTRREAARQLEETFSLHPPRALLVRRLADRAVTETDPVVWRYLLEALRQQDDQWTLRLVYAAVCHPSSGVRQAACEHLGRHPSPQHAAVLLAAIDETSESVTCAALEALGSCHGRIDPLPIVELLGSHSELLQVAAAETLTRLDRPEGPAALERLAYSHNDATRLRVAQVMGELGLAEFAPTLIRFLDDRHGIRVAALGSLPQVAACREAIAAGLGENDRVEAWRRWAAQKGI